MINLSIVRKTKTEVLDAIFPKKCIGCRSLHSWLCSGCLQKLIQEPPVRRKVSHLVVYACGHYQNKILQKLINFIKYNGVTDLSFDGAQLLSALYSSIVPEKIDLITAIPLHKRRLAERTFNQAEVLARETAKLLAISYLDCLTRQRYSESQTHLSDEARKNNVADIFRIIPDNQQKIVGRIVLLVDDVVTSGATISEAAKVLRQAGAHKVIGLCLASR